MSALRERGGALLLCRFATGCDKTHSHGCVQESTSDVATLEVAKRIVTAAQKVAHDHSPTLVLRRIADGVGLV